MTVFFPFLLLLSERYPVWSWGINLKVNGVTFGPVVTVTVEMSGNDTGVELGVEVEVVAVRKKLLKRGSEASGFRLDGLVGFRNLFGGAVFAEERMSAELLGVGCIVLNDQCRVQSGVVREYFGVCRTGLFRVGPARYSQIYCGLYIDRFIFDSTPSYTDGHRYTLRVLSLSTRCCGCVFGFIRK